MASLGRSASNNLPPQLTSFVGREAEIAEVTRLVLGNRLLTLTGVGGCGKTRLALQVAGALLDEFPGGVRMVDLAPVSDPAFVRRAVAAALGVPEQPHRGLPDTLADSLRPRALLLLLDNCEHVLAACADLALTLLQACPDLRILATSREPLGIAGEIRWTVPPLSLPDPRHLPAGEDLREYEAVRLFFERAVAAHSAFTITDGNARAVARLCARLDGIPLAIEMAAAWVRVLTVGQILGRVADRFQLLRNGSRTALTRHQTLQTAMDWSYELLSEQERVLLSRLSVFAGGWSLEAAEAVCAGHGIASSGILDLLTHLVDKSLVVAETRSGEARYRLLEIIREYGRDRLSASGAATEMRRRHRDWYLDLAEHGELALRRADQVAWLAKLESEHDNLRAALEWSKAEEGGAETWLRLAGALHAFWHIRGYLSEGREWLEAALSITSDTKPGVRAKALCGAGLLAWRQGDSRGGILLQQGLALFRGLGDTWGIAYALHHVAHVFEGQGDYRQAARLFEESLALFKKVASTWGVGWSLHCLGDSLVKQGDEDPAIMLLEESLVLCREAGNTWTIAWVLGDLGVIAGRRGDYQRATDLMEEAMEMARRIDSKYHLPPLQCELASVSFRQGDGERAAALYRESVVLRQEIGDTPGLAQSFDGLAGVAHARRDYGRAARLFGASEALLGTGGFKRRPAHQADRNRCVASTRSALGEKLFDAAWAEGRMMSVEDAVGYALASPEAPGPRSNERAKPAREKRADLLAPREREVAVLIAEGKTNRAIAAHLSITEGTAEAHVQHILNKLGMNSRAQIAAWVVAHGPLTIPPAAHS